MKQVKWVFLILFFALLSCKKEETRNPDLTYNPVLDPADFKSSTTVDNRYFPFEVGKRYVYEGQTEDGLEHNEVVRLAETKQILGINCIVVNDKVWTDGTLAEETNDWYAQDDEGTVWYMGEEVNNYNPDGSLKDHEGAWQAGVNGAKPGRVMLADPKPGDRYRQEYLFNEAEDEAQVVALGLTVTTPYGTFQNCLKIKEWTALEPGVFSYKYYAPGTGMVMDEGSDYQLKLIDIK